VYMVPPFLAYYAVTTRNRTLLEESYNQIMLYRNYLRDDTVGMWKHVLLGASENDPGYWSTGASLFSLQFSLHSYPLKGTDGQPQACFVY
jgi:rhamnogalacturonyl hydrolase YesR